MGVRATGRKLAMQALYQAAMRKETAPELVEFINEGLFQNDTKAWALELINGASKHLDEVDKVIKSYSKDWSFDRINPIDKSILRLGLYELIHTDTPHSVIINEALEMAKRYSTDDSPKYINGILGQYVDDQCSPGS
ncbi:transcription antitermination factor NusB [bacterium]|jgi:transcription antitermination protein NusB|nr:transcription antitermination factor NusB [bacterium]